MIGRTIAHYEIQEQIGAGGMGEVYRALDSRLGRQIALKFLPRKACEDKIALDRFLLEARTASALNHQGICTIWRRTRRSSATGLRIRTMPTPCSRCMSD